MANVDTRPMSKRPPPDIPLKIQVSDYSIQNMTQSSEDINKQTSQQEHREKVAKELCTTEKHIVNHYKQ